MKTNGECIWRLKFFVWLSACIAREQHTLEVLPLSRDKSNAFWEVQREKNLAQKKFSNLARTLDARAFVRFHGGSEAWQALRCSRIVLPPPASTLHIRILCSVETNQDFVIGEFKNLIIRLRQK